MLTDDHKLELDFPTLDKIFNRVADVMFDEGREIHGASLDDDHVRGMIRDNAHSALEAIEYFSEMKGTGQTLRKLMASADVAGKVSYLTREWKALHAAYDDPDWDVDTKTRLYLKKILDVTVDTLFDVLRNG